MLWNSFEYEIEILRGGEAGQLKTADTEMFRGGQAMPFTRHLAILLASIRITFRQTIFCANFCDTSRRLTYNALTL